MSDSDNILCPCCGKPTTDKTPKFSLDLIDRYIACIMTGNVFTNDYPLYNNKIIVTAAQLTLKQIMDSINFTNIISQADIPYGLKNSAIIMYNRYIAIKKIIAYDAANVVCSMVLPVLNVLKYSKLLFNDSITTLNVLLFVKQMLNPANVSGLPSMQIDKILFTHNMLVRALIKAGFDLSFYHGIQYV